MFVRRVRLLIAAAVVLSLLPASGSAPAIAAAGDITTYAGGFGQGPATKVSQRVRAMVARGTQVYMGDEARFVVRAYDTETGLQRVIAGNGESTVRPETIGDGGPATSAALGYISAMVLDPAGNLYIADSRNHYIRKMEPSGRITIIAGNGTEGPAGDGGPARAAALDYVYGMAFDAAGNLYLSGVGRIRRIDLLGTITLVAGGEVDVSIGSSPDGIPAVGANINPYGIAVDGPGNLYFGDGFGPRLRKVSPQGILSTFASNVYASSILLRPEGGFYTTVNNRVEMVDPTGRVTSVAGTGAYGFSGDGGLARLATLRAAGPLAVAGDGNLYIADANDYRVRRVDQAGIIQTVAGNGTFNRGSDGIQAADAQLQGAGDIVVGPGGATYIAETLANRVRRVDASGIISTVAGATVTEGFAGDGGPAVAASLSGPTKVAVDGAGNLYVADAGNRRVRRVAVGGVISTVAGNGTEGSTGDGGIAVLAAIGTVGDIAVDAAGNLYISEPSFNRVRRVDRAGFITTVAGTGQSGSDGDGGAATAARLAFPNGLAFDDAGTLFIADSANGRIRSVTSDGRIGTFASGIPWPWSVTSDRAGGLFVGRVGEVIRVASGGSALVAGTGPLGFPESGGAENTAKMKGIAGLAFDGADLYIALTYGSKVRKVELAGLVPVLATPLAWGLNSLGQAGGAPTAEALRTPAAPAQVGSASSVAAGYYHGLSLTGFGTVRAWGWNNYGQLGTGTTLDSSQAMAVPGLSGIRQVAAGGAHSLALTTAGTVWAWGYNGQGQLGLGSTVDGRVPVQVPGLTGVTAIAAGGFHSLAVKADGSVWSWGWNGLGALGDTSSTDRWSPVPIGGLPAVTSVAGGAYHSLAVGIDGTVWSWGWNGLGQLGNGTVLDTRRAAKVAGVSGVRAVAGGIAHSLAVGSSGQVWAWGWNGLGQLGTGGTTDSRSPVSVPGIADVRSIAAGGYHSLASRDDGSVWAWGWNGVGQLGTASTADSPRPAATLATGRTQVAAGAAHSVAA